MGRVILLPVLAWHVTGQPASIFLKSVMMMMMMMMIQPYWALHTYFGKC